MKKIFLLSLMAGIYSVLPAQNSISGRILDPKKIPLSGATIFIPELNKGVTTDKEGNYFLDNLPDREQKIQFSFVGYRTYFLEVIPKGNTINPDIILEQISVEGQEIVISGGYNSTQHENAVRIDVLKLNSPSLFTSPNFTRLLQRVPGIDMISKGSGVSKPVIRGLSMNDILVLNNGVRFENYQYSSHHPLGIDEFGIEEIEIIKGPSSLLYGSDAIGGVINFIKEKPSPIDHFEGDYTMRLYSNTRGMTNNIGLKGSLEKISGGIRIGQKTNSDFLQGGGIYAPNSRFNEYSIKSNAGYSGKNAVFRLFYDYTSQKLGLVEPEAISETPARGRKNKVYFQKFDTQLISTQNKVFLGKFKADFNSSFQNTELTHVGKQNVFELQMKLSTLIYETKIYLPSDSKSEYIIGLQGINQLNTNLKDRVTILLPDAGINNYSIFGMIQKTLYNKLKLQAGSRLDKKYISTQETGVAGVAGYRSSIKKNYLSFSGSSGAIYTPQNDLIIRLNIASAFRTPNLAELTSDGQHETRYEKGNQSLVPENSYEVDLSLHLHKDNYTFDLSGFYNIIDHYIYISPTLETTSTGIYIYEYLQGNSFLYGGETGLHFHPQGIKWIHLESTFSTVKGIQNNGNFLPFIPADKLNFEIRSEAEQIRSLKNGFVSFNFNYAFKKETVAPDESETKDYLLINFSIGGNVQFWKQEFKLELSADNMFDKKYVDHLSSLQEVGIFNPGRNISLSMKIPFGN